MSPRTPLIIGNWKMYKTVAEALELATVVKNAVAPTAHGKQLEVALAPPL